MQQRRALKERQQTFDILDRLDQVLGIDLIIHGDAQGADRLSQLWAERLRVPVEVYPANWKEHGKAAGPIRNTQMLDEARPDLVVAFPGGIGTSDMLGKAINADGVEVFDFGGLLNTEMFSGGMQG